MFVCLFFRVAYSELIDLSSLVGFPKIKLKKHTHARARA